MDNPALARARELVDEIYTMTKALTFSDNKEKEQEEAEAYVNLMGEREILVAEMAELREELDDEARTTPQFTAIMKRIKEIDGLDKSNQIRIQHIHDNMRGSIKTAKKARQVSTAYNTGVVGEYSQYVDTKK